MARFRLARSENVGPILFRELLSRFGSAARALDTLPDLAMRGGRKPRIGVCEEDAAAQEIEALERLGGRWVVIGDDVYPDLLAAIEDPPPVISIVGEPALLANRAIAIVGARNASANGRLFARKLASDLGGLGTTIVSGLARGIDTAAHEGALESGTVAVVGGGVDVVYPKENAALHEAIAGKGAIVAESALGTIPQARHFPRRNRLISGLSVGVAVVEAAAGSGSLITARLAGEQGRDVFAVPGSPLDPRCRGSNNLLRQGAILTEGADDILDAAPSMQLQSKSAGPSETDDSDDFNLDDQDVGATRRVLLDVLGTTPVEIDVLIRESGLNPATVKLALIELELAGKLERQAGAKVARIAHIVE